MQRVQSALNELEGVDTYDVKVGTVIYTGDATAETVIRALENGTSYKASKN